MKTDRKKLFRIGIISSAVLVVGVLIAYFAARNTAPNLIAVGEGDIGVSEVFTPPNQTNDEPFYYRKRVQISNTGSVPCYIRVRLEFSNSTVQNAASFSSANPDSDTPPDDSTFYSAQMTASEPYISHLPAGWVYVTEDNTAGYDPVPTSGYYYYSNAVKPGKATDALISWVKMNYGSESVQAHDLYVYAESVQTIDPNTGTPYPDWNTAWYSFAG